MTHETKNTATALPKGDLENPLLQRIASAIADKATPQYRADYLDISTASEKLAFDPDMNEQLLEGLRSSPDISKNVALVCAGVIGMVCLSKKYDPATFLPPATHATVSLMCQILDFAEQSGMIEVTPQVVDRCTALTSQALLARFGIDERAVNQLVTDMEKAEATTQAVRSEAAEIG